MTSGSPETYDVVIVGGGPAGLSAALALGRARKRVLVCDAGPRRNAAAARIYNFVTRDGTPPDEFRLVARQQLAMYPKVEVRDVLVRAIAGERGAFRVELGDSTVVARRLLLCTGMLDVPLALDGFADYWGHCIIQCPYCHGWEARDRRWGLLALPSMAGHFLMFALQLRAWTGDLTVFTNNAFDVSDDDRTKLVTAGIRIETAPITRLVGRDGSLEHVTLAGGVNVPCAMLFAHPPQRQVQLINDLGVALDDDGFVKHDPMKRETSVPGIYVAGDLTTRGQSAVFAASAGTHAAASINVELTIEQALAGEL